MIHQNQHSQTGGWVSMSNQQDGYALVWMHPLKMGKPSVQDNL